MVTVDDKTFDGKYNVVIDIFKQWMPDKYNFSNATILDFGCEHGIMALAIAMKLKAKKVIGIDVKPHYLKLVEMVGSRVGIDKLPPNLSFFENNLGEKLAEKVKVDVIFSWSTFEHVRQSHLDDIVTDLYNSLNDNGFVFLQISPLYYSPFGSHLQTLIDTPWAHLTMQKDILRDAVMTRPKNGTIYAEESDENYAAIKAGIWDTYDQLNLVTADEIIRLFERHGFMTVKKLTTNVAHEPSPDLSQIYMKEVLQTEQLVALFQKNSQLPPLDVRGITFISTNTHLAIDTINGHPLTQNKSPIIIDSGSENTITVTGWAIDKQAQKIAGGVLVSVDRKIDIPAFYGIERPDVANAFKDDKYHFSGFSASFAVSILKKGRHTLSLKIINAAKNGYYEPDKNINLIVK